jgi:hypothetical protein
MYLSIIIRHTLIPSFSRSKNFILRFFRSLSLNGIWLDQNPIVTSSGPEHGAYTDALGQGCEVPTYPETIECIEVEEWHGYVRVRL